MCANMNFYFVAKCADFEALNTSHVTCEWASRRYETTSSPHELLQDCYSSGHVFLIFSVNESKGWQGVAKLIAPPTELPDKDGWHKFKLKWELTFPDKHRNGLPFSETTDMAVHKDDGDIFLNRCRNYTQIPADLATKLIDKMKACHQNIIVAPKPSKPALFNVEESGKPGFESLWSKLNEVVETKGRILMTCPFGSQRYNLANENSDMDMFVVYMASTRAHLSLTTPPLTIKSHEADVADFTVVEVKRFCDLVTSGDPRSIETCFLPSCIVYSSSNEFKEFCESYRKLLLTKELVTKYLGDALGTKGLKLLHKWLSQSVPDQKKINKLFYIVLRNLVLARQAARGEGLQPHLQKDSPDWKLLSATRAGHYTNVEMEERVTKLKEEVEGLLSNPSCPLPDHCDVSQVEKWLLKIRCADLCNDPNFSFTNCN